MVQISAVKGYDPNSYGLIYRGNTPPDENYIATRIESGLVVYVLNPLKFIKGITSSNPIYNKIPDFRIFVRSINIRGIVTHEHSSYVDKRVVPIRATRNIKGENPYDYAQELINIAHVSETEPPNLEPYRLDYIPDIAPYTAIKISELPDIDLTSSESITINAGRSTTLSFPIPYIIDKNRHGEDQDTIIIEKVSNYSNGFRFKVKFAGQDVFNDYTDQPRQMAVLDNQQHFMITDYSQDKQMKETAAFHVIPELIDSVITGDMNSIYEMLIEGVNDLINYFETKAIGGIGMPAMVMGSEALSELLAAVIPGDEEPISHIWEHAAVKSMVDWMKRTDPKFDPPTPTQEQIENGEYDTIILDYIANRELDPEIIETFLRIFILASAIQNPTGILDMYKQYFLYDAREDDRKRLSENVGGNVVENMLNKEFDQLIHITYPVADRVETKNEVIYLKDFAENESHEYPINKVFNNINAFLTYVNEKYPGELLNFDGEPILTYGDYTLEYQKLLAKGLLLI